MKVVFLSIFCLILFSYPTFSQAGLGYQMSSSLSQGKIFQVAISEDGIYKISHNFLVNEMNLSPADLSSGKIEIFSNPGGLLSPDLHSNNPDDLIQKNYLAIGMEDGSFDENDYLLVYLQGPDRIFTDPSQPHLLFHEKNIYTDFNYAYIRIGVDTGRPIETIPSINLPSDTFSYYDELLVYHEDQRNLLHEWTRLKQGSGQYWYNNWLKVARTVELPALFDSKHIDFQSDALLRVTMALRAGQNSSFQVSYQGQTYTSPQASRVTALTGYRDTEVAFAHRTTLQTPISLQPNSPLSFTVHYPQAGEGSEGWLDFVHLQVRKSLQIQEGGTIFRNLSAINAPYATFEIENFTPSAKIWAIDSLGQVQEIQGTVSGSKAWVTIPHGGTPRSFLAFNPQGNFPSPLPIGAIEPQNLHGIQSAELIIIYPEGLREAAEKLARHRTEHDGYLTQITEVSQIFHEFGGGKPDPTAIRAFVRMVKSRSDELKYVLLLGDGSFDHRNRYELGNNLIPVYETESLNPINAFPSDDFYGILFSEEDDPLMGNLDVAVGRLPVGNLDEAMAVVDKLIQYDTQPTYLGNWRNRLLFVADDEDNMLHTRDADQIADQIRDGFPQFNIEKIYLDAFEQISTPGEQRYPEVTTAIEQSIFQGMLTLTYLGHGGINGLAQERILEINDLLTWNNFNRLPLIVTATCSFTAYDEPSIKSAGEVALLNPSGGAIGLLTTVRAVYAQQNADLTERAMQSLFERNQGKVRSIGEAMKIAKNSFVSSSIITNSRKFALIGDPAQKLAIPELKVYTETINEHVPDPNQPDTLKALQKITLTGYVGYDNGDIAGNFNGEIFPLVFDKPVRLTTLGQDDTSYPFEYEIQNNRLFKGRASVENGEFSVTFVMPKDINYEVGPGKISYYAQASEGVLDAGGFYDKVAIGSANLEGLLDDQGPEVNVYMNTTNFSSGDKTSPNPLLLVYLKDENGINVAGNSIGHDLEAILDDNERKSILLNDFYESNLDDYTSGWIRFPMSELEEGMHTIQVKAWDVANNLGEGGTSFLVVQNEGVLIDQLSNYPNPFIDETCFSFDLQSQEGSVEVEINIFSMNGQLVKKLEQRLYTIENGGRESCIQWDGRGENGASLGKGIYLYSVKISKNTLDGQIILGESPLKKLVLLK